MHDAIAAFLEQTKEAGKHRRGLLLGIVEQHNSATIGFDPLNDKMKLLLRRHRIPVAGHESAPKTTMPRRSSRSSRAADEAKPGKRKNGVRGIRSEWP